ncbi:MAG: DMT family transporter [Alphaproteobacteria bacterium]|nr:MAG: DMT family transporter [Alphaproteobacteria bacterium]
MQLSRHQQVAFVGLIVGGLAIALSPIFVRLSEVGPTATAFWRVALAFPAALLLAVGEGRGMWPRTSKEAGLCALAGLSFAGDLITWHWSIHYTSVTNATLFANAAPIIVTLGGWLLFGQRFSLTFLAGMALALGGAAILVGVSVNLGGTALMGDGLALTTALFYAGYFLAVKHLRATLSTGAVMLWTTLGTSLAVLPIALVSEPMLAPPTLWGWAVVAGLALVSHAGGQGLIAWALASLPAAFSSVTLLIQPLAAALLAWVLLGEALSAVQIAGGLVLLLGIYVARRG